MNCPACQKPLGRETWNSRVDIVSCLNLDCPLYHRPQGNIPNPENAKLFAPLSPAEIGRRNRNERASIMRTYRTRSEKAKLPCERKKYIRAKKPRPELFCPNCGKKVDRDDLGPAALARRKRIFCGEVCWRKYQRTHPRWKG